ncbi:MAG: lipase, partial [Clostridia bacterium]|nr:lipase [Clostridia bacterium]
MSKWVTVWGNAASVSEHRPETYAKDITLRYPVKCAFAGNKIRLHFSNFCGTEDITLNQVTIAPAVSDREINLKDAALVTFSGKESVKIKAGQEIFSDELDFRVKPLGKVSVCIYLKDFTLMRSSVVVTGPLSSGFYSLGNCALKSVLPLEKTRTTNVFYFLTGVDLLTDDKNRCVICYGDSITSQSWPDYLSMLCMDD